MSRAPVRVRFAPSPTGTLHLGNARTALFNWLVARAGRGVLVLRIEDTDVERHRDDSEEGILRDLRWLGLDWDEGPDVGGPHGPYRQSGRGELYRSAVRDLAAKGRAYPCFCTEEMLEVDREEMRADGRKPRYAGRCASRDPEDAARRARAGEPHVYRFRVIEPRLDPVLETFRFTDRLRGVVEVPALEVGDPVIVRRAGTPTYNFAVVVDDAAMGINLVVRGDDHLSNTPVQAALCRALGHPEPEYAHLPMVRGEGGARLSKRHGAVSVEHYRRLGYPPEGLLNSLALLGWSPPGDGDGVFTPGELLRAFDLDRVSRAPSTFDPDRLDWLSGQHVHRMPADRLGPELITRLVDAGSLPPEAAAEGDEWTRGLAEMLRTKLVCTSAAPAKAAGLFHAGGLPEDPAAREVLEAPEAKGVLESLASTLAEAPAVDLDTWRAVAARVKDGSGARGRALYQPMRVALTGSTAGPELDHLVPLATEGHRRFPGHVSDPVSRVRRTLEALA